MRAYFAARTIRTHKKSPLLRGRRSGEEQNCNHNGGYDAEIPEYRIKTIVKEFNVNRHWLETGEGVMFVSEKEVAGLQPNARFKAVRKYYGLSMGAFGQKIGLGAAGVSAIEYGTRNMTEKHIKLICAAFPEVSEDWLRTGEGEMLLPQDESAKARAIAKLVQGMEYCEWRRIAHAIDRAYEMAANRAVLTQEATEEAVMHIGGGS